MGKAIFVAVIVMVTTAKPQPARADLASAIYDDVRDVIEELIQAEIATGVVASIERDAPGVAFYFRDTLDRLASPYWGSLPRVLREDLDVAVADFVYFHLSGDGEIDDLEGSARRFFRCVTDGSDPGCARLRAAVLEQQRTLLDVECRRVTPARDRRIACDLGFATLAALQRRDQARRHVIDAIADMVLADYAGPAEGRLREVLVAWLEAPASIPQPLIEMLGDPALHAQLATTSLDLLCKDRATLRAAMEHPGAMPAWACFAISHKDLPEALVMKVRVTEGVASADASLAFWALDPVLDGIAEADFGDNALYGAVAEAAVTARCKEAVRGGELLWPCKGEPLGKGAELRIEWMDLVLTAKIAPSGKWRGEMPKAMAQWVKRWQRLRAQAEAVRRTLPPMLQQVLFIRDTGGPEQAQLLRSTVRMTRLLQRLRERWYLWSEQNRDLQSLDIGELLELTRDTVAESASELGRTGAVAARVAGAGGRDMSDWFRLVAQADHRTLATETLRAGFGLAAKHAGDPHQRFFLTLAAYLLDASDGGSEGVTRSAFRAAAKDLLRRAETRGVPGSEQRVRLNAFPRLAIRAGFNEAYAIAPGDDTRRGAVAIDWPTAMVAFSDNAGLEVSVLDLVAPLAELALRPAGEYADETLLGLDLVRPRAGVWLAVPQLSRRLEVSTGVGARLVGLDVTAATETEPLRATYVRRTSLTVDLGVGFVF